MNDKGLVFNESEDANQLSLKNLRSRLLYLGVGIVLLISLLILLATGTIMGELTLPVRFTLNDIFFAAILIVVAELFCRLGEFLEIYLANISNKITEGLHPGETLKHVSYLIAIFTVYVAFYPLLVPYLEGISWIYPAVFAILGLIMLYHIGRKIYAFYPYYKVWYTKIVSRQTTKKTELPAKERKDDLDEEWKTGLTGLEEQVEEEVVPFEYGFSQANGEAKLEEGLTGQSESKETTDNQTISRESQLIEREAAKTEPQEEQTSLKENGDEMEDAYFNQEGDETLSELLLDQVNYEHDTVDESARPYNDSEDGECTEKGLEEESGTDLGAQEPVNQAMRSSNETGKGESQENEKALTDSGKKCSHCGATIKYGSIFCTNCFGN